MKKNYLLFILLFSLSALSQENIIQNGTFEISDDYDWVHECFTAQIFNNYIPNRESQLSYVGKYRKKWQKVKHWQKVKKDNGGCR